MKRIIIFLTAGICLTACSVRHFQTAQRDSTVTARVDSVRVLDSVYIDRIRTVREKADTVYVTDVRTEYKYRWRDRVKIDTLIREKVVTETQLVEKELTPWQDFRLKGFWYLLGSIGLWIAWKIAKLWLHL